MIKNTMRIEFIETGSDDNGNTVLGSTLEPIEIELPTAITRDRRDALEKLLQQVVLMPTSTTVEEPASVVEEAA